jgi:hypothetical protein
VKSHDINVVSRFNHVFGWRANEGWDGAIPNVMVFGSKSQRMKPSPQENIPSTCEMAPQLQIRGQGQRGTSVRRKERRGACKLRQGQRSLMGTRLRRTSTRHRRRSTRRRRRSTGCTTRSPVCRLVLQWWARARRALARAQARWHLTTSRGEASSSTRAGKATFGTGGEKG